MRHLLPSFICGLLLSGSAVAQLCIPPEAESFYTKAMKEIKPSHSAWIRSTNSDIRLGKSNSDNLPRIAAGYGQPLNLANMDIEALMMFVMMQVQKDAEDDIRNIMEEIKRSNEQKKKIREVMTKLKQQKKTSWECSWRNMIH